MRALDPAFAAHLSSGATTLAYCWRIARPDGVIIGLTDHDRVLSFGGTDYAPMSGADGAAIHSSADLSVDNSEIAGLLSSEALSATALSAGRFNGANVEIWRVNWRAPDERMLLKAGRIGEVRREGAKFTAEIRGRAQALDETRGRIYGRLCDAVLGDARCRVDLDAPSRKAAGVIAAVLDETRYLVEGLESFSDGWFSEGRLDWTSGANAGSRAIVRVHAGQSLSVWLPPAADAASGDSFEVRAGCDKRAETCRARFDNMLNFRGFHLIPGDDFAISYPLRREKNDGGRR